MANDKPIIDLSIHSDDTPHWRLTPRTAAAKEWIRTVLKLPDCAWESLGYFQAAGVNCTFDAVLASARAAGLVLSFTSEHASVMLGGQ